MKRAQRTRVCLSIYLLLLAACADSEAGCTAPLPEGPFQYDVEGEFLINFIEDEAPTSYAIGKMEDDESCEFALRDYLISRSPPIDPIQMCTNPEGCYIGDIVCPMRSNHSETSSTHLVVTAPYIESSNQNIINNPPKFHILTTSAQTSDLKDSCSFAMQRLRSFKFRKNDWTGGTGRSPFVLESSDLYANDEKFNDPYTESISQNETCFALKVKLTLYN